MRTHLPPSAPLPLHSALVARKPALWGIQPRRVAADPNPALSPAATADQKDG
jgi:hypothetical protein